MTIAEIVERRGITEVLHFTTNMGLIGILAAQGVLCRSRLREEQYLEYVYSPNAKIRRDLAWLGYVNLSISELNKRFFAASENWHESEEVWWCAIAFDPVILSHPGVHFATTNNFYSKVKRAPGTAGLEALFGPRIDTYNAKFVVRPDARGAQFPTCPQAEVLYPDCLSTEYVQRIYVRTGAEEDWVGSLGAMLLPPDIDLPGSSELPVEVRESLFA